jgi:hypothetical protein
MSMFSVDRAPRYVAESRAGAARLQEQTTPEQYAALAERARRLLDGMFRVETSVDPELQVLIALREKFDAARVKQAILLVATWQLIHGLSDAMNVRTARPAAAPRPAALLAR